MKKEWNPGHKWLPQKQKKAFRIMKLTFLFSVCFAMSLSATSLAQQRVSMQLGETKLKKVFEEIQRQTNHVLVYSDDQLRLNGKVTANFEDATVEDVLGEVLQGMGMTFRFENDYIVITRGEEQVLPQTPESVKVSGTVKDKEGHALPGVTVLIKGTQIGVATDVEGKFSLNVPDNQSLTLVFSMVGMKTQEVSPSDTENVVVVMEEEASDLDEAIVIGYGTATKKDLTGSVARFDSQILEESVAPNVAHMMQGQIPGLSVLTGDGAPGSSAKLEIRGVPSLGSVSPLIVVDNVPMTSDFDINELNPDDIENIDVLKGASSAAIYGSRAAGGVIMITTKNGKRNQKPVINYSYDIGISSLVEPINTLNTDEFKMLLLEAARNTAKAEGYNDINDYSWYRTYTSPGYFGEETTPWMEYIMQNGITQQHRVSLRGGSENIGYNASFGYTREEGEVKSTQFDRYTYNAGFNADINPYVKATVNVSGTISKRLNNGSTLSIAAEARPDIKAYNEDGTLYLHSFENAYGTISYYKNPIIEMLENTTTTKMNNMRLTGNLEFKILPELSLLAQYSYQSRKSETESYQSSRTNVGSGYWGDQKGAGSKGNDNVSNHEVEVRLTYDNTFNDIHRLTAVGVYTYTKERNDNYNVATSDFSDDYIQNAVWQGANPADYSWISGDASGSLMLSYVGRVDYRLLDRYLVTASVRADGSSRFAPDNRWGIFPSVALGWVITEENFMQSVPWISFLKLRAGWGKTGNGWVGEYGWRTMFTNTDYENSPAVVPSTIGNDNLKWETTKQWDLGLDYAFLEHQRIRGTLGFYLKKTDGLLYPFTMAPSTGMSSTQINFANIENKGVEFDITADIIQNQDWNWSFGFNINKNLNKITNIDAEFVSYPGSAYLGSTVIQEGESLGLIYGFETNGIFQNQAQIDYYESLNPDYRYQEEYDYRQTIPGDLILVDQNGDGRVNVTWNNYEDMVVLGCSRPKFEGGFNTRLGWKGLTLSLQATFSYGAKKIWDAYADQFNFSSSTPANVLDIALKRWTPENPNNEYPCMRLDYYSNYFTDFSVFKASYLKISNINLNYELPKHIIEKTKIFEKANFFVSVNNVHTFTSYPGPSPESFSTDVIAGASRDSDTYPKTRTFNFGVNVTIK